MSKTKIRNVTITTDDDTYTVGSPEKFDAVLDSVRDAGRPTWVEVVVDDNPDAHPDDVVCLQIGLGADYSTVAFYDANPSRRYDSVGTLPMPNDDKEFVVAGTPTAMEPQSAIPVEDARRAAREFAATGRRPESLNWREAR